LSKSLNTRLTGHETKRQPTRIFPLRSLLFVPGNNPKMIQKSWATGADGLIFDLEDAVPESAKEEARENVRAALETALQAGIYALVRINSCRTPHWQADVNVAIARNLHGIVIPKCESPGEVTSVVRVVRRRERAIGLPVGSIQLFLLIETARGLLQAQSLVQSSRRVKALMFGAEDFCLNMGLTRTAEGQELLYARSHLVTCARAHDCRAVDTVYPHFEDSEGLARETRLSKALGFSGKLAIHPKQVAVIHSALAPSPEEVSEAHKVLEAFARAQATGSGVIAVGGRMVDEPVVQRARQVVAMADTQGKG
jgi:citrate lyase subunit beta / citryl-CoA lyase